MSTDALGTNFINDEQPATSRPRRSFKKRLDSLRNGGPHVPVRTRLLKLSAVDEAQEKYGG